MDDKELISSVKSDRGLDNLALNTSNNTEVNVIRVQPSANHCESEIWQQSVKEESKPNVSTISKETSDSDIEILELPSTSPEFKAVANISEDSKSSNKVKKEAKPEKSKLASRSTFRKQSSLNIFSDTTSYVDYLQSNSNIDNSLIRQIIDPKSQQRQFIFTPPPPGVVYKCQINKTNNKDRTQLFTIFLFSVEMSKRREDGSRELFTLMAARNRKKTKSPNCIISLNCDNIRSNSADTIGKLRGSFIGQKFKMLKLHKIKSKHSTASDKEEISNEDNNDDDADGDDDDEEEEEDLSTSKDWHSLGVIFFKNYYLGKSKPRRVSIALPSWNEDTKSYNHKSSLPEDEKDMKTEASSEDYYKAFNLLPTYNKEKKVYSLDFGGRVKETSVKNFALTARENDVDKRIFQFGKTEKHFIVDFTYPISPFQAFCIGLSTCHRKLISD